jgi:hypothetical protein
VTVLSLDRRISSWAKSWECEGRGRGRGRREGKLTEGSGERKKWLLGQNWEKRKKKGKSGRRRKKGGQWREREKVVVGAELGDEEGRRREKEVEGGGRETYGMIFRSVGQELFN